jgi:hypothetical protein
VTGPSSIASGRCQYRRPGQRAPGQELLDAAEEGLLARDEPGGQELRQHRLVEPGTRRQPGEDRLDLGAEAEARVGPRVVERLDAEPVTGEQQAAPAPVPQREGEHPAEPLHAALAHLLVQVKDGLGVAPRLVTVAARLQLRTQRGVVVDLAVERDPDLAVGGAHRLVSARDVDDGEPSMREAHRAVRPEAGVVRAAVAQHVAHAAERLRIDG